MATVLDAPATNWDAGRYPRVPSISVLTQTRLLPTGSPRRDQTSSWVFHQIWVILSVLLPRLWPTFPHLPLPVWWGGVGGSVLPAGSLADSLTIGRTVLIDGVPAFCGNLGHGGNGLTAKVRRYRWFPSLVCGHCAGHSTGIPPIRLRNTPTANTPTGSLSMTAPPTTGGSLDTDGGSGSSTKDRPSWESRIRSVSDRFVKLLARGLACLLTVVLLDGFQILGAAKALIRSGLHVAIRGAIRRARKRVSLALAVHSMQLLPFSSPRGGLEMHPAEQWPLFLVPRNSLVYFDRERAPANSAKKLTPSDLLQSRIFFDPEVPRAIRSPVR